MTSRCGASTPVRCPSLILQLNASIWEQLLRTCRQGGQPRRCLHEVGHREGAAPQGQHAWQQGSSGRGAAQKRQGGCHQQGGCQHQHLHCKPQVHVVINPVLGTDWIPCNTHLYGREGPELRNADSVRGPPMHNQLSPESSHRTCRTTCCGKNSRAMYRPTQVPLRAANACTHGGDKLAILRVHFKVKAAPVASVLGKVAKSLLHLTLVPAILLQALTAPAGPPLHPSLLKHCSAVLLVVCTRCSASASTRSKPHRQSHAQTVLLPTGHPVTKGGTSIPACTTATSIHSSQCSKGPCAAGRHPAACSPASDRRGRRGRLK